EDVHDEPTQALREIMKLAAERDLVARQYASDFAEVWETGLPALLDDWREHADVGRAIVRCQLGLMAAYPDTLILRKVGLEEARASSVRAANVLASGWPETAGGR